MTYKLPTAKLIFFTGFIGFLVLTAFATRIIFAQDTTGATGIQVSAPVYNFTIDPGGTSQEIIKVRNVSDGERTFFPEVFNFKPIGETGTPQFITGVEKDTYTYSLASWIKISREAILLKSNESAALNFTINVPSDAEPGGAYAGILFGTKPPQAGAGEVAISNKVGALILVRVAGDAKEIATLKEFSSNSNFYENPPVNFIVRIENKGTVHVRPKGIIEIKDTFGRAVEALDVNEKEGAVLPESIRRFDKNNNELTWSPGVFTMGRFTANLVLAYGDPAQQITGTFSFWVIPWKVLLVVGLGLVIIVFLLILLLKRYNLWIVDKAERKESKGGKDSSDSDKESGQTDSSPPAPTPG